MHSHDVKFRWVFSPLTEDQSAPIAAEYSLPGWIAPRHHNGFALVLCPMSAHQLASARQDPRLIVLGSVHSKDPVPRKLIEHHAELLGHVPEFFAKEPDLHGLLIALAKHHHCFEPTY